MADLNDWKRGDPLTAAHLNESPSAIRALLAATSGALGSQPQVKPDNVASTMIGEVTNAGPGAEADFGALDPRQWVKIKYVDGGNTVDTAVSLKDDWDIEDPVKRIVPATNLSASTSGRLPVGSIVQVLAVWDSQVQPIVRYMFIPTAAGTTTLEINITDTWTGNGLYKCVEVDSSITYSGLTTSTNLSLSAPTTVGAGSNSIAINLRERDNTVTAHKVDLTGTYNTVFPARKLPILSTDGKAMYIGWFLQMRPGCA